MKIIRTAIPDVLIFEPAVFKDDRGWFMESFNQDRFNQSLASLGLKAPRPFVQDNHSCSKQGVLRGLHYQLAPYAQGKLVRVSQGSAFDVAVDLRRSSPTFGKWAGVELSGDNNRLFWIPEGFAHGFIALQDNTHFLYKTTDYYQPGHEAAILWNDPELAIDWKANEKDILVSPKDALAHRFAGAPVFD